MSYFSKQPWQYHSRNQVRQASDFVIEAKTYQTKFNQSCDTYFPCRSPYIVSIKSHRGKRVLVATESWVLVATESWVLEKQWDFSFTIFYIISKNTLKDKFSKKKKYTQIIFFLYMNNKPSKRIRKQSYSQFKKKKN